MLHYLAVEGYIEHVVVGWYVADISFIGYGVWVIAAANLDADGV